MTIRPMTITDYDAVFALWKSTPGMGLNSVDDSREGIQKYLDRNPTTCFVAQEGQQIIGAIMAGHDGRRAFMYHLAVTLSQRGQGVGRALVAAAIKALRAAGIAKVALVVMKDNAPGNEFWEKAEFTPRPDLVYRNKTIADTELPKIAIQP